jgi:beta,beta-carotene 9',10'-dioxygenase
MVSVNAFDDGDDIVLDMCKYRNADIVWQLGLENARATGSGAKIEWPHFTRYRLPAVSTRRTNNPSASGRAGAVLEFDIPAYGVELPRINERNQQQKYRFVYAICSSQHEFHDHQMADSLVKLDIETREGKVRIPYIQ